ncbi:MAG TPA: hypothetical protein ENI85_13590 [Deltaproteobacteria bacterium]|nr:hypothetical protein [Deltaproteobacteria bacterium]
MIGGTRRSRRFGGAAWCASWMLLFAPIVGAEELQLGLSSQYVYNSNFFSNAGNANAANSFQIGPVLALSDSEGRFTWNLGFTGAYQVYVDQSGVDAWESRVRARGTYDIDRRTSLRLTERFRDISNLRFSRQDIALADTALDPNRSRYFRNDLELELTRDLSRRLTLGVRGAHHWIDFERNIDRNDSQAFEVGSELRYRVASQHVVGLGISYVDQEFERALSRLGSRGQYLSADLRWTWVLSDGLRFSMNGGPAWIRSDEDDTQVVRERQFVGGSRNGDLFRAAFASCQTGLASDCDFVSVPPIPATDLGPVERFPLSLGERVGHATEVTFFGGASITIDLADWNLEAAYSRRQSTTSGDGLASSLDRVSLDLEFAPRNLRWSGFIAGSWDRRETLTEATVVDFLVVPGSSGEAVRDQAITTIEDSRSRRDNFTAIVGVRGAVTRAWSGTLEFRYRRTEPRDRGITRPGVDTYFVLFTVDFGFDVIRF